MALAPREGEAIMPLTERSLALLGTDDHRRRNTGAVSEWDYVNTPSPVHAPLAGSPAAATSFLKWRTSITIKSLHLPSTNKSVSRMTQGQL